jgi:hypothetical protein
MSERSECSRLAKEAIADRREKGIRAGKGRLLDGAVRIPICGYRWIALKKIQVIVGSLVMERRN